MRHVTLLYELNGSTCLTPCLHKPSIMIGSGGCSECKYNNGNSKNDMTQWVYCTFPVAVKSKNCGDDEMGKVKENALKKFDYEILFKDSPDYYLVKNAKFLIEGTFIRFICFEGDEISHDKYYPVQHIHRIKRYYK